MKMGSGLGIRVMNRTYLNFFSFFDELFFESGLGHSCNEPNLSKLFFMFRRAFFESDRGQGIMRGMWAGLGDH